MEKRMMGLVFSVVLVSLIALSVIMVASAETGAQSVAIGTVTVTSDGSVNIRSEGNADAPVVIKAKPGEVFTCTGKAESGWYEIMLDDGRVGYISPKMVEFAELAEPKFDLDEINARIQSDPNDALAYQDRGDYYQARGEYEKAYDDFSRAIELDGTVYQYISRAAVLRSLDKYEEALDDANLAIDEDGTDPTGYTSRASAQMGLKNYEAAMADINTALALDSTYGYGYYVLASCLRETGDLDGALEQLKICLSYDPDRVSAYNTIGFIYAAKHDYREAVKWSSEAIKRSKNESDRSAAVYYNNRGTSYLELKEYKKAIKDLEKAIELREDFANAYHSLSFCYGYQKNYKMALEYMEKAVALDPKNAKYKQDLAELRSIAR